ncbi:hypothetical protein FF1_036257 [Malus domestica]
MAFSMYMLLNGRDPSIFFGGVVWLLLSCSFSFAVESDINCLKILKALLQDPLGYVNASWDFNNKTEGFICNFLGIECWHPHESKVLNIKLSDLGLKGPFPRSVANCTSLTGLDLSSNKLSGPLPEDIAEEETEALCLVTRISLRGLIAAMDAQCWFRNKCLRLCIFAKPPIRKETNRYFCISSTFPATAEALAILRGYELAAALGHRWVIIESDLKDMISSLSTSLENGRWEAFPTLTVVKWLGESFQDCR